MKYEPRKISWVQTMSEPEEHDPDGNPSKLVIIVDRETEITVWGFGCGDYKLRIRNINPGGSPDYSPEASINGFKPDASFWGVALVWAEPCTIAHLVMDVITGQ